MEIALSGFNPQFDTSASVEAARQRQRTQQESQQPSSAAGRRGEESQQPNQTRAENNSRTPETARVINGEVLSSETSRVNARDDNPVLLTRSPVNQQAPGGQADTRRIPVQQAIQTFEENESLVSDESAPRQVSGIIDEFV